MGSIKEWLDDGDASLKEQKKQYGIESKMMSAVSTDADGKRTLIETLNREDLYSSIDQLRKKLQIALDSDPALHQKTKETIQNVIQGLHTALHERDKFIINNTIRMPLKQPDSTYLRIQPAIRNEINEQLAQTVSSLLEINQANLRAHPDFWNQFAQLINDVAQACGLGTGWMEVDRASFADDVELTISITKKR